MLAGRCTAEVEKVFEPILNMAVAKLAKDQKFWEALAKEMSKRFAEIVSYQLQSKAKEWAEVQAAKIIENLDKVTLKPLYTDPLNLEDPKGCATQVEDLLMEEFAKTMAAAIAPKPK